MNATQRTLLLATTVLISTLILVAISSQLGTSIHFNLSLQQWLTHAPSETATIQAQPKQKIQSQQQGFTLVELPKTSDTLTDLLNKLRTLSPQRIFWVLPDTDLSAQTLRLIEDFDVLTVKVPSDGFNTRGELIQQSDSDWQPAAGYLIDVEHHWGLARKIPFFASNSANLISPAATLNHTTSAEASEANPNNIVSHFVDFSKATINSPVLSRHLTTGAIPADLIEGRDIWLLNDFQLTQSRIKLPNSDFATADNVLHWHPVQYHAMSLLAIENGAFLLALPSSLLSLTIAVWVLLFAFISVISPANYKRINCTLCVVLMVGMVWLVCSVTGYVAPIFEVVLVSAGLVLILELNFTYRRTGTMARVESTIDREISPLTSKQQATTQEKQQQDFWAHAASLISQNLNLNRTIFFQLPPNHVRLVEIASINCELSDIFEMRRDINREPYAQAVQSKQAVDASRPYFKNKEPDEFEILAPFFKGPSVLGFWALTTKEQDSHKRGQLKEQVNLLSTQISVLLDLQQQNVSGELRYDKTTRRYGCQEQHQLQQISSKLNTLVAESNSYLALFTSMSTPALLFDVFGQLSMVNKALHKIAHKAGIDIQSAIELQKSSAFELLSQLLPLNEDSLRNIIRQLTLEQNIQQQRFFVTLQDEEFVAVLSSVKRDEENVFGQYAHLQISGLLCEFHSLKSIQNYLEIERGLYDNYMMKIKNYLSTLQMGLIQIERKAENPLLNQLSAYLNVELKKASDITRRTHYFMNKVTDRKTSNTLPFRPVQMLQKRLDKIHKSAQETPLWRGVTFQSNIPTFPVLGLGSPDIFDKIIHTTLRLLADDAIAPKTISIMAKQLHRDGNDILFIKLESEGYGLPDDQLQQMYEQNLVLGENTILSELLMALQSAKDANMDCRLKSKVGKGYRLSILIEGISLHD